MNFNYIFPLCTAWSEGKILISFHSTLLCKQDEVCNAFSVAPVVCKIDTISLHRYISNGSRLTRMASMLSWIHWKHSFEWQWLCGRNQFIKQMQCGISSLVVYTHELWWSIQLLQVRCDISFSYEMYGCSIIDITEYSNNRKELTGYCCMDSQKEYISVIWQVSSSLLW